ncbi:helix-turn-helix transcriptional regulator [Paenibacillus sp. CGMCC 1.16610]|uniref:Helix-turn-helix domain-containing protein n=1 Tax=Paenibacillus anseongense TaxID=2682845 RepID=A0ABW9U385_9BACL|nr:MULTISPECIES: helix-turn-helix transcriptional regulator [Paenibacillus]MBA2943183.1 helix-turn-helix transcriptional regulator [Paenibacillus sp. CGMCC 1.16610]MVQ33680.1 helix-turn-helix domain-containing protein [Paenibacillus anseongense]
MVRKYLVNARELLEMSHEHVAKAAEISRQYYGMIENGTRTPAVPLAKKIGQILKIDWTLFFEHQRNDSLLNSSKASSA